jgi:hypothetical protein
MPVGTDMGRFYAGKPVRPFGVEAGGWMVFRSLSCRKNRRVRLEGEPCATPDGATSTMVGRLHRLGVKQPGVELALAPKLLIINLGVGRDGFKGATHRGRYFSYAPDSTQAL